MTVGREECSSCRWWHKELDQSEVGSCRREAPRGPAALMSEQIPRGIPGAGVQRLTIMRYVFPRTGLSDWCGEYAREEVVDVVPDAESKR